MIKRYALFIIIIMAISCGSISVDSMHDSKCALSSIDALYITPIDVRGEEEQACGESLCRMLAFSLHKRNFKTASFLDQSEKKENYRHHARIIVYINRTGDVLNEDYSNVIFITIRDSGSGETVMEIQLTCEGCDLRSAKGRLEVCEALASRIDRIIKG